MRKLIYIFCLLPLASFAQESTVQSEFVQVMSYNSAQIMALAEAIPAETYDWRPGDGVRSVAEALMHTASTNYFFGSMLGADMPEGIDPMTMEKTITSKEEVTAALKQSFDWVIEVGKNFNSENFQDQVSFPNGDGQTFSKRMTLMIVIAHAWEHTGQVIAYARTNDIVPPWSIPQTADGDE